MMMMMMMMMMMITAVMMMMMIIIIIIIVIIKKNLLTILKEPFQNYHEDTHRISTTQSKVMKEHTVIQQHCHEGMYCISLLP